MVCSTPFVHVGDVDLNTKTWKFIQISFKNHYLYSNRFGQLYTVIMDMNVNKDSGPFRNLLTMLTKSMVLEHVMLCMQNYVDHYAGDDLIKNNEHYSLIKNFVIRMTTVSLEEALVDCTQLYERMRMIGQDLHMIDFECQIRKNIDAINTVLFPSVNSAYGVLQTNIVKLTNKLKDMLVLYHLEDLTLKCQKCKCGNIYHQHKDCSHKLCAKCAFQSLLKVKRCVMCKKLDKIRNREIDNIDHSDSEGEYDDNNVTSSSNKSKLIIDDEAASDDDDNVSDNDDNDDDDDHDKNNDDDNDSGDDDDDNNARFDENTMVNSRPASAASSTRPSRPRSASPNRRRRRRSIASPRRDDGDDDDSVVPPIRRKRIIDRSIFTPSPSPSRSSTPPPPPPQPPATPSPPKSPSPPPPVSRSPSVTSRKSPCPQFSDDDENIENINKHLRQLNDKQNELFNKKQKLNEIINNAQMYGNFDNNSNNLAAPPPSNESVMTRLPDDHIMHVNNDDNANDLSDNRHFSFEDAISDDNNDNDAACIPIINELLGILQQQTSSTSEIIEYIPPSEHQSVQIIPPVEQQSVSIIVASPLKLRVVDLTPIDADVDADVDATINSSQLDRKPIIKTEPYDSLNDEPFEFFQYHCQDGVVIKLEKDDPVYVETPYEPPTNISSDDDDDDVMIVSSSDASAFKPKRFPIKVTRYAHVVSEEYIGGDDNDQSTSSPLPSSSQPPLKKIKLEKK